MISWTTILYGALLSALAALGSVLTVRRERRTEVLAASAAAAALGPLLWNAILHRVGGREFFVDAPVAVLPASWQDVGSGVFTVAVASALLGLGPLRDDAGRRLVLVAVLCGAAAFLVDVYLY